MPAPQTVREVSMTAFLAPEAVSKNYASGLFQLATVTDIDVAGAAKLETFLAFVRQLESSNKYNGVLKSAFCVQGFGAIVAGVEGAITRKNTMEGARSVVAKCAETLGKHGQFGSQPRHLLVDSEAAALADTCRAAVQSVVDRGHQVLDVQALQVLVEAEFTFARECTQRLQSCVVKAVALAIVAEAQSHLEDLEDVLCEVSGLQKRVECTTKALCQYRTAENTAPQPQQDLSQVSVQVQHLASVCHTCVEIVKVGTGTEVAFEHLLELYTQLHSGLSGLTELSPRQKEFDRAVQKVQDRYSVAE